MGNCGEVFKDKLQILQNRAARMITRSTYDTANQFALLRQLKWLDVRSIIKLEMGLFRYKAMNQLVPEQISEMFTPLSTHHSHQTRSVVNGILYMPTSYLFTEQRSLSYATSSKLWNEIPFEIRNADSLNSFKTNFKAYLLEQSYYYSNNQPSRNSTFKMRLPGFL